MQSKFKISCLNLHELNYFKGDKQLVIYELWFGDKVYIGTTKNISERISTHLSIINQTMNGRLRNETSYDLIISHIKACKINTCTFKIHSYFLDITTAKMVQKMKINKNVSSDISLNDQF